jgi:hypothetical protein
MSDAKKRRADHRDERYAKANHLGRCPGLHVAVGGRVKFRDTASRSDEDQQHQPPADAAKLV